MEERAWELIKGTSTPCRPPSSTRPPGELYRVAYRCSRSTRPRAPRRARAAVPFGPETWSRVNVSGEFKHCLLSLSAAVSGSGSSHATPRAAGRDIAVYRRDERFFNLYPHAPTTRHARDSGGGGSSGSSSEPASPDAIPAELVSRLASFVNEPSAEAMHSSIGAWPSSISDLFITIPLRRLLILDENNCLSHWISCGELCEDSDDDEVGDPPLPRRGLVGCRLPMAIDRFRGAEALRALTCASAALTRGRRAGACCEAQPREASLGGSEAAAVAGAAERLGLGGAGLPPGETGKPTYLLASYCVLEAPNFLPSCSATQTPGAEPEDVAVTDDDESSV
eukprot:jgi/Tetstr1/432092/TSEL_021563.t1